ncbi:hypothetical protein HOP38_08615 [Vibrio mediterranei]|uniref:hypothetical protein n=1 Tax=Vibrio mediterranei TaxID=689 RepID=UPI0017CB17E2|nr:hypothetical protein [Vibrio mediterranei]NUW72580.1 hypothetical protein [Vibrio mediterranei]
MTMKPCFPAVPLDVPSESPVRYWLHEYQHRLLEFTDMERKALSRLLPLLVCGEQSSQWVFYNESVRKKESPLAIAANDFERIVADEKYHEEALEWVRHQIEEPADILAIKRRSQRFFASLGARKTFEEHFAQIACLDALVCKLMLFIEKGSLGPHHPFTLLCRAIKQDEARHVSVSKLHAIELGYDKSRWRELNTNISDKLYELLNTERDAFEVLGVNLDMIFETKEG